MVKQQFHVAQPNTALQLTNFTDSPGYLNLLNFSFFMYKMDRDIL